MIITTKYAIHVPVSGVWLEAGDDLTHALHLARTLRGVAYCYVPYSEVTSAGMPAISGWHWHPIARKPRLAQGITARRIDAKAYGELQADSARVGR